MRLPWGGQDTPVDPPTLPPPATPPPSITSTGGSTPTANAWGHASASQSSSSFGAQGFSSQPMTTPPPLPEATAPQAAPAAWGAPQPSGDPAGGAPPAFPSGQAPAFNIGHAPPGGAPGFGGSRPPGAGPDNPYSSGGFPGMRATVRPQGAPTTAPKDNRSRGATVAIRIAGVIAAATVLGLGGGLLISSVSGPSDATFAVGEAPKLPDLAGPAPTVRPTAPLTVAPPSPFEANGVDTATVTDASDADKRRATALAEGRSLAAAAWSDRAVRLSRDPFRFAEHAALLSAAGDVDGGMYWLVRAIDEVGVDPTLLVEDVRFGRLWQDPRWASLAEWAVGTTRYHAAHHDPRVVAWLPNAVARTWQLGPDAEGASSAPTFDGKRTVVWLAPSGTDHTLVEAWAPALADSLDAAFVAVDPPRGVGIHAGTWTGDLLRDRAWVEDALGKAFANRRGTTGLTIVGAGRSGRVGVDLALRAPSNIASVIAMTPDRPESDKLDPAILAIYERDQRAILVAGADQRDLAAELRSERARMVRAGVHADLNLDDLPWAGPMPHRLPIRMAEWLAELRPGMETPRLPAPDVVTEALGSAPIAPSAATAVHATEAAAPEMAADPADAGASSEPPADGAIDDASTPAPGTAAAMPQAAADGAPPEADAASASPEMAADAQGEAPGEPLVGTAQK